MANGLPPSVAPELTAVVVVGPLRERAGGCVRALLDQGLGERLEILLVDVSAQPEASIPIPGSESPRVGVLKLPPETLFAEARAQAVDHVRAPILAYIEEHARPLAGWAEALLRAYREPLGEPWAAVGYGVVNGNPGVGRSDINFLTAYGYWLPPFPSGEASLLPGQNISFRTAVLRQHRARLAQLLRADLVFYDHLRRHGERLAATDQAVIAHLNEVSWSSRGRGIFHWYRSYAVHRAREGQWSLARRSFYILATPVVPFYALAKLARLVTRTRPNLLSLFWRSSPLVLVTMLCGATGQALGLLIGEGEAARHFTKFELTEPRPERP